MHQYQYWYWVLVSLEANIIGYWIMGAFLGIVLTLITQMETRHYNYTCQKFIEKLQKIITS